MAEPDAFPRQNKRWRALNYPFTHKSDITLEQQIFIAELRRISTFQAAIPLGVLSVAAT